MTTHIAMYGKGGVGTSTLLANIGAALAEAGFRVLLVGCASHVDAGTVLGVRVPPPDIFGAAGSEAGLSPAVPLHHGYRGIATVALGVGQSAPDSISKGIEQVRDRLVPQMHPDFVLYDVSGTAGFVEYHRHLAALVAARVYVVTSADFLALATANELLAGVVRSANGPAPTLVGGIIPNGIASSFEQSLVSDFARQTSTRLLGKVPRSLMVRQCELYGKTVLEAASLSNQAYFYRRLAQQIADDCARTDDARRPHPMPLLALQAWGREWADRLHALENGLVNDGAAI